MSIEIKLPLVFRIRYSVSQYYILIPYQFDYMCTVHKHQTRSDFVDSVQFGSTGSPLSACLPHSLSVSLYRFEFLIFAY